MSRTWLRRGVLLAACAASLLLAACGSSTIESQLNPTRVVTFGDAFADLGQKGSRYTVNDGTVNNWTEQVALAFGLSLTPSSKGGTSYATGHARVVAKPDDVADNATPTVKEQIDKFLAADKIGANDLYIVNAGTSDLIVEGVRVAAGAETADQAVANSRQAGRDLAAQVRRLVDAGARFVVVVGPYNLGRSPWAVGASITSAMENASGRFNDDMLVQLVDLGDKVLYVDAALEFNLMVASPPSFSMTDSVTPVCTSVDPGPGIGIGSGQVNSALCTPSTVLANATYNNYLFADKIYPTPAGQNRFGDYAFQRIRSRW
ncbi:SGNH/GDSL hydrolase family protein [Caenimonas terrae]|uniref:SGNH/GDSL hydrolase family protein n=1 Tax=Caenimonas terrae TaxID=696074 RepID=A0ABW0N925_9BURK